MSSQSRLPALLLTALLAVALLLPGVALAQRLPPGAPTPTPGAPVTAEPVVTTTTTPEVTPAVTTTPVPVVEGAVPIVNDEGGPVVIRGQVDYTDPYFTLGVAAPMVILEDQAGFVDRDERFIMPLESQTIGQITSDFFESPFTYSVALPIVPQGTLRDVDNDGEEDPGVMTFAVAYWTNTWGDPFLEERDLYGGGWSTAYASTRVSEDWETRRELIGGKLVIFAPEEGQGFPVGFGADGLLFTEDDPIGVVPQGYTIVDMDTAPFTFARPAEALIDLIEPEGSALDDYSEMSYADAFDALVEKMRKEYAFSEYKAIDWDALLAEFRPRFEEADANADSDAYETALRDFAWRIPDGHVSGPPPGNDFYDAVTGSLAMAIRELDDGSIIATFVTEGAAAAEAGIVVGDEILSINGVPVAEFVDNTTAWSGPFSTAHVERLDKLRYAVRFPLGTRVDVAWRNAAGQEESATLRATFELESYDSTFGQAGSTALDLPVEYDFIPGTNYVRAAITSFSDNSLLAIQLWERMITALNEQGVAGLVIDMRNNLGGSGFLADQMAAYFFDDALEIGQTAMYDKSLDEFKIDERSTDLFYPPDESLRFAGPIAVLVGPNCNSACEFFSYDMTIQDRAAIVGQYPTAGLGGGVASALMPEGIFFQMTIARALDMNGEIHIEGRGVAPTVQVDVTEETLLGEGDAVLDAAVEWLDEQ